MNISLPYRKVIYANCGLSVDSIEYLPKGKGLADNTEWPYRGSVAIDSFIIFTDLAGKLSFFLTMLMLMFSVFSGLYTLIVFIGSKPVEGWTTTMLVMSFGFFGMFALLSAVIKYLSVILNFVFKKAKYVIKSIEKLG
jgi:dolichol-phosphate mannosyltransferase